MRPGIPIAAVALAWSAALTGGTAAAGAAEDSLLAPDFVVGVAPSPMTTVRARAAAATVTITVSGGFDAAISLSASGLPSGATSTFSPQVMPAPGGGTGTLTLAAGAATPAGSYAVTVTGTGGSLSRTKTVTFTVTTATVTIYSDGFEDSLANWEMWHYPGKAQAWWGLATNRKAEGSRSAYCAAAGSAGVPPPGPYPANMEGSMTYGPFSLADATDAMITFKYWMNNHDSNDKLQYFVSLNNSYFYGREISEPSLSWTTVSFDLGDHDFGVSPVGRPEVWFEFGFVSDGSGQSEGAYVDAVTITKDVAPPACAVNCSAIVPTQGSTGSPVQLTGSVSASNCTGLPAFAWTFGDSSPASSSAAPTHAWQNPGNFGWQMTASMGGKSCVRSGTIAVTTPVSCSLSCGATVPAAGARSRPVGFDGSATPTNCPSPVAYAWSFGDGGHAATADAQHAYAARGNYSWTFTVTSGTETCTKTGTVAVGEAVRRHLSPHP